MIKRSRHPLQLNATQTIVVGFLFVILVGTGLLMLPFCSADGTYTPFMDALFTATTSTCVTGLTVVTTATHWSFWGKLIILLLIQLGGFGVITVYTGFLILIGKKLMIRESMMIQEQYNLENMSGVRQLIRRIVRWTLSIEAIGAVGYAFAFIPKYGLIKGCWYSVFHAVSAFCNAGIDLIGPDSLVPYVTDPIVNLVTMFLVITGAMGFVVLWDTQRVIQGIVMKRFRRHHFLARLSLHSQLAYVITAILLVSGFLVVLILEWNNPDTIGNFTIPQKCLAAAFQSVTTRTAGMATIDQSLFRDETILYCLVLMFIGGSPMGTAGGVKTTTVGIVLLTVWSHICGRQDTEVFGRKISAANVRTGLAVVVYSLVGHLLFIFILLISQNGSFLETLFEVVSALGTVGLTMGMTAKLNLFGQLVVVVAMFMGRLGPITIAIAFALKPKDEKKRELPEKRVIIG